MEEIVLQIDLACVSCALSHSGLYGTLRGVYYCICVHQHPQHSTRSRSLAGDYLFPRGFTNGMGSFQFRLRLFEASGAQGLRLPVLDSNNPFETL